MMIHFRFLIKELSHSRRQSIMFVLCVVLSVATLTALNSFKRDIYHFLISEARDLHGGDIIISSPRPFNESLKNQVDSLEKKGQLRQLETYEFYSVIRSAAEDTSLFVNLKSVDSLYPFYGDIVLESGRQLRDVLRPGSVVVAREVLERLDVALGSTLRIGKASLEIGDVITYESVRPVSFFSLGPRVFVSSSDLELLDLLGGGSRAKYKMLLKIDDQKQIAGLLEQLAGFAKSGQEQIVTAEGAPSRLKRFFDNLLFFLLFTSLFTLLLSGIGMQGTLGSLLRQKRQTIGVVRAVGATFRFLLTNYLLMVLVLGLIGSVGGIIAAYGIKMVFPILFSELLPSGIPFSFTFADIIEGLLLGLSVVCIFTFLPLYGLSQVKPAAIFRSEGTPVGAKAIILALAGGLTLLFFLIMNQIEDIKNGFFFMVGLLLLITLVGVAASTFMYLIKRAFFSGLSFRQAVKSLHRPGNGTRSIVVTLTSAFTVLLAIFLLKLNLFAVYIDSYPEDAPNLFCIDIQQDQADLFRSIVGGDAPLFPVIRARLASINGEPVNREREQLRKSDNLGREFNLTYRDYLLDDEKIIKGEHLFGTSALTEGITEVSVLDTIAEIGNISIGDQLVFNIQGVILDAQVTSIRSRTKSKLYPFFYFVFKPEVLEAAPKTFFAALYLPKDKIPRTITEIVSRMPNISTINVADMAIQFGKLFKRLSVVVSFFASFSIIAGLLIMVSTMLATRPDRLKEVAYYKVLGADSSFVYRVTIWENLTLGVFSSVIATIFAQIAAYLVCRLVFDIEYNMYWLKLAPVILAEILLVLVVGFVGTIGIAAQKPALFLRQQDGV